MCGDGDHINKKDKWPLVKVNPKWSTDHQMAVTHHSGWMSQYSPNYGYIRPIHSFVHTKAIWKFLLTSIAQEILGNKAAEGLSPNPSTLRRVVIIMSTYEEFMIILTTVNVIIAILNMKNKK